MGSSECGGEFKLGDKAETLDANTLAILNAVSQRILTGDSGKRKVVDVGCGEGRLLARLQENGVQQLAGVGWNVETPADVAAFNGIDLSQSGWSDRLGGRRFDWVVSTEVIEHLVNPFNYLNEMRKIIELDGRLLLTFPNVHNWRSIIGYAIGGRFSGFFGPNFNHNHPLHDQHIFIPNLHLVRYFLRLTGFTIAETAWVNGSSRLMSQTVMLIAKPCDPVVLP